MRQDTSGLPLDKLELKIPPVVVFALAALGMWQLDGIALATRLGEETKLRLVVAVVLLGVGVAIGLAGVLGFYRSATSVNPHRVGNASTLVTGGIYRRTRNPMYLGLLISLLAYAVALGNPVTLIAPPIFVIYMNRFQIIPEERALEALFPDGFGQYKRLVRRWL